MISVRLYKSREKKQIKPSTNNKPPKTALTVSGEINIKHGEMKMSAINIAQVPSTNQATSSIASNTKVKPVIDLSDSLPNITEAYYSRFRTLSVTFRNI